MIPIGTKIDQIDQAQLKWRLKYDPETGEFRWLIYYSRKSYNKIATVQLYHRYKYYLGISLHGKLYQAHRLAWLYMTGSFPIHEIDHIDGDGCNNIFSNLREVTRIENMQNTKLRMDNTSKIVGVSQHYKTKMWQAQITYAGKQIYLGTFVNKEDAIAARLTKEKELSFHPNHGKIKT